MVGVPAAMVAIYFVLAVMFNSLLQPLLIMAVIPFGDHGLIDGVSRTHAADVSVWTDWRTWNDWSCGQ